MRLVDRFPQQGFGLARTGRTAKEPIFGAAAMKLFLPWEGVVVIAKTRRGIGFASHWVRASDKSS